MITSTKEHTNLKIVEEDLLLEVLKILSLCGRSLSLPMEHNTFNPIFFLMIYLNHLIPAIDE